MPNFTFKTEDGRAERMFFDDLTPLAMLRHLRDMFPLDVTLEQVRQKLSARDYAFLDAKLVASASHESVLGYFVRTWKSPAPRMHIPPITTEPT